MRTNLRLEDGRIGEQPEVAYHVVHAMLFGGLAMVSEGWVCLSPYCSIRKIFIGTEKKH